MNAKLTRRAELAETTAGDSKTQNERLVEKIQQLTADHTRLIVELDQARTTAERWCATAQQVTAEHAKLREALNRYGHHDMLCGFDRAECECGLTPLLAPPDQPR